MVDEKYCKKCDSIKKNTEFYKDKRTKNGLRCYCKLCENKMNSDNEFKYRLTRKKYRENNREKIIINKRKYYKENKEKINEQNKNYTLSFNGKLNSYKNGAKNRNLVWELTNEDFLSFWQQDCFYCGDSIPTIGIDRVDNKKGYILNNCTPCCGDCNKMKLNLPQEIFLNKILKISKNLNNSTL